MRDEAGPMGKLILLHRVREEAEREALARAADAEARAQAHQESADARVRLTREEQLRVQGEAAGEQPLAQVLQFRSRALRQIEALLVWTEAQAAAARGERISAAEAAARVRASLAAAHRACEQLQERLAAARRQRRRRREQVQERAQDDTPGPRGGPGPSNDGSRR